uniref:Putative nucleolar protein 11 n=1 Tax=Phlebotomus kandelakii TaxID=1109342 RepID=A0A6B2EC70_9DIPT
MAKLLAYYTLCPVNDSREFLGISADSESGAIINTLTRNIVIITKLSDQKQIRSWTALEKLSNKVVFDGKSRKYVGVFGQRNLKCWSDSETNLKKIRRIKLQKNVKDLVTFGEEAEILVLFDDGSCCGLPEVTSGAAPNGVGPLAAGQDIEHPRVFSTIDGELILTFFVRNLASKEVDLMFSLLDRATKTPDGDFKRIRLDRGDQRLKLVGYSVTESLVLITIWSDKRIFRKALRFDEEEDGPGQFIAMLSAVSVEHPLSVVSVSPDYLAIYGANAGQEGSSLILYNLTFNVVQAKQFFKVYFDNSRLFVVDRNILLVAGQTLAVVPFRISRAQLADMVGSQRSPQKLSPIEKDYINEEDELEQAIKISSRKVLGQDFPESHQEVLKKFRKRPQCVTSVDLFDEQLSALKRSDFVMEFLERDRQKELEVKIFTHPLANVFSREEFELLASELEASGASEMEISDQLISLALASETEEEAMNCLRRYSCISEKNLVKCLIRAIDQKHWEFLLAILSVDFSHDFLVEELRSQLDTALVFPLLKRLLRFLESSGLEERPRIGDGNWDGDERLIEWLTALLDAHYHHMVMCGEEKVEKLLKQWRKVIQGYWMAIAKLKDFSPVLYSVSQNKVVKETKATSKWYSIEVVQLY